MSKVITKSNYTVFATLYYQCLSVLSCHSPWSAPNKACRSWPPVRREKISISTQTEDLKSIWKKL